MFYPKFPLIEHWQKTFDVFPCKSMHEKSFQTYISALKELKMLQKTAFSSYLFFPRTILPFLIETHLITLIWHLIRNIQPLECMITCYTPFRNYLSRYKGKIANTKTIWTMNERCTFLQYFCRLGLCLHIRWRLSWRWCGVEILVHAFS